MKLLRLITAILFSTFLIPFELSSQSYEKETILDGYVLSKNNTEVIFSISECGGYKFKLQTPSEGQQRSRPEGHWWGNRIYLMEVGKKVPNSAYGNLLNYGNPQPGKIVYKTTIDLICHGRILSAYIEVKINIIDIYKFSDSFGPNSVRRLAVTVVLNKEIEGEIEIPEVPITLSDYIYRDYLTWTSMLKEYPLKCEQVKRSMVKGEYEKTSDFEFRVKKEISKIPKPINEYEAKNIGNIKLLSYNVDNSQYRLQIPISTSGMQITFHRIWDVRNNDTRVFQPNSNSTLLLIKAVSPSTAKKIKYSITEENLRLRFVYKFINNDSYGGNPACIVEVRNVFLEDINGNRIY